MKEVAAIKYLADRIDDIGILCKITYRCPYCQRLTDYRTFRRLVEDNITDYYSKAQAECEYCKEKSLVLNPNEDI